MIYSDINDWSKTVPWQRRNRKHVSAQWRLINNKGTQTIYIQPLTPPRPCNTHQTTDRLWLSHNIISSVLVNQTSTSSLVRINSVIFYPVIISGQFWKEFYFPSETKARNTRSSLVINDSQKYVSDYKEPTKILRLQRILSIWQGRKDCEWTVLVVTSKQAYHLPTTYIKW